VGLERRPLSLVSTTEELLGRKSSGSGLETEITAVGILQADHVPPLSPQKLTLTSPTRVGIVRLRIKATEFSFQDCIILEIISFDGSYLRKEVAVRCMGVAWNFSGCKKERENLLSSLRLSSQESFCGSLWSPSTHKWWHN
jgi:hypothetical protein